MLLSVEWHQQEQGGRCGTQWRVGTWMADRRRLYIQHQSRARGRRFIQRDAAAPRETLEQYAIAREIAALDTRRQRSSPEQQLCRRPYLRSTGLTGKLPGVSAIH